MKMLQGYKRWIGLAVGALAAGLWSFGVITEDVAGTIGGVGALIFGAGWIDAHKRGSQLMADVLSAVRDNAPKALAAFVFAAAACGLTPLPVSAQDGGIIRDNSLDLRVLKLGQTIAVDIGAVGGGARILPADRLPRTVVDLQPTFVDPVLGTCKLWNQLPWCGLVGQGPAQ